MLAKAGEMVFVATLGLYYTGRVAAIDGDALTLESGSSVVYRTGHVGAFFASGEAAECSPLPAGVTRIEARTIVSAHPWPHGRPAAQRKAVRP